MRIGNVKKNTLGFESTQHKRELLIQYAADVLKGKPLREIYQQLATDHGFTENQSQRFINEVKDTIAESTAENNEKIIAIHLEIYEEVYSRFEKLSYAKGKMAAMAGKERLLHLFEDQTTEVTINTQNNINIPTNYDVSKLNQQQQLRFQQLINKATNENQQKINDKD